MSGAGGTQRLPRLVGIAAAKQLIYTAEKISSEKAERIGLVNISVGKGEALSKSFEIAEKICEKGPIAIRMAKLAIDKGIQLDIDGGMEVEGLCYGQVIATSDRVEGLKSFIDKRAPKYLGE